MAEQTAKSIADEFETRMEKALQQEYQRGFTAGFIEAEKKNAESFPSPCVKNMPWVTVKDFLQKLNEEVDEFKEEVLRHYSLDDPASDIWIGCEDEQDKRRIAEEGADVSVVIASFCEKVGICSDIRKQEQEHVNAHNKARGRL